MKRTGKKGFTLLEVLLVVSIMILLMGMMGASVGKAIERAKISKAQAETAELVRAWKSYRRTYGDWPSSFSVDAQGTVENQVMTQAAMDILLGLNATDNPKRIKFIDLAKSTDGMKDPWNRHYIVYFNQTGTDDVEYYQTSVNFPAAKRYIYEREY